MTSDKYYESLLGTLTSIPSEEVVSPSIPVKVFIQEAENLYHWAKNDIETLTGAGLAPDTIENLQVAAGALRFAEGEWYKTRYTRSDNPDELSAYELRNSLIRSYIYAFRKNEDLIAHVRKVSEGTGDADMIQDLVNLRALGLEHTEALQLINFDFTLLDKAATTADQISEIIGEANADPSTETYACNIRNRAYTYLRNIVTDIRECGKYVFHRDKRRLRGYSSEYYRKMNRIHIKRTLKQPMNELMAA